MKIMFSDFLNITMNNVSNKIELSLYKEATRNGNTIKYYDTSLSLVEGINIKIFDTIYTNLKFDSDDEKFKYYTFDESINYKNHLKENIDVNDIHIIDENKDNNSVILFEKYSDNKPYMLIDSLFSKLRVNSTYKTILYIPSDKKKVSNFLYGDVGGIDYIGFDDKKFYAFLLTNVKFEYNSIVGVKNKLNILYDNHYILSETNVRFLKIQTLVL